MKQYYYDNAKDMVSLIGYCRDLSELQNPPVETTQYPGYIPVPELANIIINDYHSEYPSTIRYSHRYSPVVPDVPVIAIHVKSKPAIKLEISIYDEILSLRSYTITYKYGKTSDYRYYHLVPRTYTDARMLGVDILDYTNITEHINCLLNTPIIQKRTLLQK